MCLHDRTIAGRDQYTNIRSTVSEVPELFVGLFPAPSSPPNNWPNPTHYQGYIAYTICTFRRFAVHTNTPTQPAENRNSDPLPTQPDPTRGSTQPTDNSELQRDLRKCVGPASGDIHDGSDTRSFRWNCGRSCYILRCWCDTRPRLQRNAANIFFVVIRSVTGICAKHRIRTRLRSALTSGGLGLLAFELGRLVRQPGGPAPQVLK